MNTSVYRCVALAILAICLCIGRSQAAPILPPADIKGDWSDDNTKDYLAWKFDKFRGQYGVADGGSALFEFTTDNGVEIELLVCNRAYWTDADIANNTQVVYLIKSGKYYLLEPKSKQEKHMIAQIDAMIKKIEPTNGNHIKSLSALRLVLEKRCLLIDALKALEKS